MNFDEINRHLADLLNCGDPTFANAANYIAQISQQAQAGQLSASELGEILLDVQRQLEIVQEMSQMAYKQKLNTIINGLLMLAKAV